jgi:hypothetical protein
MNINKVGAALTASHLAVSASQRRSSRISSQSWDQDHDSVFELKHLFPRVLQNMLPAIRSAIQRVYDIAQYAGLLGVSTKSRGGSMGSQGALFVPPNR